MRHLRDIAADFLAHRSVERAELLRLYKAELFTPVYTTDEQFTLLGKRLGVGGHTGKGIFHGLTSLPKH